MEDNKATTLTAVNRIDALSQTVKQIAVNLLEVEKELTAIQKDIYDAQEVTDV